MNLDYTKAFFESYEIQLLKKQSQIIIEKFPGKKPILIRLKSNVLKTEKYKFLLDDDITLYGIIEGISSQLQNIDNHNLQFDLSSVPHAKNLACKTINCNTLSDDLTLLDIYNKYRDTSINAIVIDIKRKTLYKILYNSFF
jgi:hypothetical protein